MTDCWRFWPRDPSAAPQLYPASLENHSGRLLRGFPIPGVQSESVLPAAASAFEKLTETTSSSAYNPHHPQINIQTT